MLQSPLPLPSAHLPSFARPPSDHPLSPTHRRPSALDKFRQPFTAPTSTAVYPSAPSSASPSFASRLPRSPLLTSSPVPRSPHPLRSPRASDTGSAASASSRRSSISSTAVDVLTPGDVVGEGLFLQGERIRRVPIAASDPQSADEPASEFEVVRSLGTGSYAVVYLVREVLARPPPSDDGHCAAVGRLDLDEAPAATVYGREYAIKVLSKANLDEEALAAQMFEATIHQSLPAHPNIVTLHRTLETPSFLLLLLEFVPGEDLFYFLEQARDHYDVDPSALDAAVPASPSSSPAHTPPTPSLLATLNPSQLLSRTRLHLIASMFAQMCDAVAVCHEHQVFHRDIKPENFIVTDGWTTLPDGRRERKVIVKLTDFGLSTTDVQSADMDCGSAPYMSFECRNNIHPTYSPRAADVWSLGIVLINMLYHYNPWTDTTQGACASFALFLQQPITFFMTRFTGMTPAVADFLATRVFCLLDTPADDARRVDARAFGIWIRDLPSLMAPPRGHARTTSVSSIGHRLASIPHSRRPSLRNAVSRDVSQRASWAMSRAPSLGLGPAYEVVAEELPASTMTLSPVPSLSPPNLELSPVPSRLLDEPEAARDHDREELDAEAGQERSASTQKRRKRGARKGKGVAHPQPAHDDTLDTLAEASQALAREISRTSRSGAQPLSAPELAPAPAAPIVPPTISKKSSKWKLSFGKAAGVKSEEAAAKMNASASAAMSATASNVTSLLMGLDAPPAPEPELEQPNWQRGRTQKPQNQMAGAVWGPAGSSGAFAAAGRSSGSSERRPYGRAVSPASTRSGRPLASSASSTASSNWRSSMSSAGTSTSAFTRYSNSSARSVATAATSLSSGSWRSQANKYPYEATPSTLPANVKFVIGTPWELNELPRQMYQNPTDATFSAPPVRKRRAAKAQDSTLDTICERAGPVAQRQGARQDAAPVAQRQDAATSTTDLDRAGSGEGAEGAPRKVQKGQINALAKMLSALRR